MLGSRHGWTGPGQPGGTQALALGQQKEGSRELPGVRPVQKMVKFPAIKKLQLIINY